jgi:hypothetical protein
VSDAEAQFREALYRSAIEAAYYLKRLCEGTEDETRDADLVGMRLGAAAQLLDAVLAIVTPDTLGDLELTLVPVESNVE